MLEHGGRGENRETTREGGLPVNPSAIRVQSKRESGGESRCEGRRVKEGDATHRGEAQPRKGLRQAVAGRKQAGTD